MKCTRMLGAFTLIVAVMLLLPMPIHAQQPAGHINFGNLTISPGIDVQGVFDDNIYKGTGNTYATAKTTKEEEKKSDFITHLKPSLGFNYSLQERGSASIGYRGDFAIYGSESKNNWKNNQGYLDLNYLAPGGLVFALNDLYARSEDPLGNADQYNVGRATKRWTNDLKTKLGYSFYSNFRGFLYYNNSKQKYENSLLDYSQDYTENEFGAGVETRFLPKTWGFLRYHYGKRGYDTLGPGQLKENLADYKWHRISTGLAWDPGAKLSGEVSVGYQMLQYDNEYADPAKTLRREDKNTWTAATSVNYDLTQTTALTLNVNRAVRNSASDNNEQFTDTGISFAVTQQLMAKVSMIAGIGYSKNEYNTATGVASGGNRSDDNYNANLGVKYAMRDWLGLGLDYNYSRKSSNAELNEYTDNQVMGTLSIMY